MFLVETGDCGPSEARDTKLLSPKRSRLVPAHLSVRYFLLVPVLGVIVVDKISFSPLLSYSRLSMCLIQPVLLSSIRRR